MLKTSKQNMTRKTHREFFEIDDDGWTVPDGYPPTITQKILVDDLDPVAKTGQRSLLMRFAPGAATTEPFAHEECEEVLIYEGDLVVGDKDAGTVQFHAPAYACRPGHVVHGPFRSEGGCLMFVHFHY